MVTGELKSKIDNLWELFWTGGLTNPLDVIEQMTYLMFIRDLDDSDNVHMKESIMLGLPYKSIFEENVTIGDRKVPGNQLKWQCLVCHIRVYLPGKYRLETEKLMEAS